MAKIAYILLCHKDVDGIIGQAQSLTSAGDYMSIHFDGRASNEQFRKLRTSLAGNPNIVLADRVKCGWGEFSLVQASLNAVTKAEHSFPDATHFYMLSGDCMSIKPASFVHRFLDERSIDYIEFNDFFESNWIKTGLKEERLIYRHIFNERKYNNLFYTSVRLQRRLGLNRNIPDDLQIMIGSQWWCLRRTTVESILQFIKRRRDVVRFFKTTWIPDETFFQTMAAHLVPEDELVNRTLTYLMFSDYGMPATFYNDHYDLLVSQAFLFARKISPDATELKNRLGRLYSGPDIDIQTGSEGQKLYSFLTQSGRIGRRFSARFWEKGGTIGREKELFVFVCKKWHVAKRLLASAKEHANIPGVAYLFDEMNTALPDLGGIEGSLEKRGRHRRAVIRMIFDIMRTDRLIICLDPKNIDVLDDLINDRCKVSIMELSCTFSDEYLTGHGERTGLLPSKSSDAARKRLIPTIRQDFEYELNQIRDRSYQRYYSVTDKRAPKENAGALAIMFEIDEGTSRRLASTPHLFSG